jgi:hypothetical protein
MSFTLQTAIAHPDPRFQTWRSHRQAMPPSTESLSTVNRQRSPIMAEHERLISTQSTFLIGRLHPCINSELWEEWRNCLGHAFLADAVGGSVTIASRITDPRKSARTSPSRRSESLYCRKVAKIEHSAVWNIDGQSKSDLTTHPTIDATATRMEPEPQNDTSISVPESNRAWAAVHSASAESMAVVSIKSKSAIKTHAYTCVGSVGPCSTYWRLRRAPTVPDVFAAKEPSLK